MPIAEDDLTKAPLILRASLSHEISPNFWSHFLDSFAWMGKISKHVRSFSRITFCDLSKYLPSQAPIANDYSSCQSPISRIGLCHHLSERTFPYLLCHFSCVRPLYE